MKKIDWSKPAVLGSALFAPLLLAFLALSVTSPEALKISTPQSKTTPRPPSHVSDIEVSSQAGHSSTPKRHSSTTTWAGGQFPPFLQLPRDLADARVLSSSEVLLDTGAVIRLTMITSPKTCPDPVLSVEVGDGKGKVIHRGIVDPSTVRIEHPPELNDAIYERLKQVGLGNQTRSSIADSRLFVSTPENPHEIVDFISAVQGNVGPSGLVHLMPIREEWADTTSIHSPHYVQLR